VLGIFGLRMAESHLSRGLGFLFNERRPAGQLLLSTMWPFLQEARARSGLPSIPGSVPVCRSSQLELSGDLSRIDIELRCDDALLHFENKPFSDETGGDQTVREAADLRRRAQILGIGRDRAVGVFLTPAGSSASSNEFVALSYLDLHDYCVEVAVSSLVSATERDVLRMLAAESRRIALGF